MIFCYPYAFPCTWSFTAKFFDGLARNYFINVPLAAFSYNALYYVAYFTREQYFFLGSYVRFDWYLICKTFSIYGFFGYSHPE